MSNPEQPSSQPAPDPWQSPSAGGVPPQSASVAVPAPPTAYGYGPAERTAPAYAGWFSRVGSALVDALAPMVIFAPALVGAALLGPDSDAAGWLVILGYVASLAFSVWNGAFRQGRTGQSLGKSALGTRLVSERTGQPVGAGMAFVRSLAHLLDWLPFYLGFLWPLWDSKKQTFADKVCATVVVKS